MTLILVLTAHEIQPVQAATQASVVAAQVLMYATQTCGYCERARSYFKQHGIAWKEIDIEASAANDAEFKARGGQGTPLIFGSAARVNES